MQPSVSDFADQFAQAMDYLAAHLPQSSGFALMFIGLFIAIRIVAKLIIGGNSGGGSSGMSGLVSAADTNIEKEAADSSSGGNGAGDSAEAEKQNEAGREQKQKDLDRDKLLNDAQKLQELFELLDDDREMPEELRKTQEEKELEELGMDKQDLSNLKEQHKELVSEISALIEKGLTKAQVANSLISRTTEQVPLMELRPLIEAMTNFLKKNEEMTKDVAVVGVDKDFERKAALSALKRGEYEAAFGYLERAAEQAEVRVQSTRREDVRAPAMAEAGNLYRAVAVLSRPLDAEKSFRFLKKSKECEPNNPLTNTMIARAYYETGKTKQAENLFSELSSARSGEDYTVSYAAEMLSQIRVQRTSAHAERIRRNYEERLGDAEGREQVSLSQSEKAIRQQKAKNAFVMGELRERSGSERELG